MQLILAIIVFVAAVAYMLFRFAQLFRPKSGCGSGCSGCSSIDVKKIRKQFESMESRKG